MKFIKCKLNHIGTIIIDDCNEVDMDYISAIESVRKGPQFSGYLFYPGDKPGAGIPIDPYVSRPKYYEAPAKYGVCIYKTWRGSVHIE